MTTNDTTDTTELITAYLMTRWEAHLRQAQHFNIDRPDDRSVDDLMQASIAGVILQLAAAANGEMKVTHSNTKEIEECLKMFCAFNGWESIKNAPPAFWSMPVSRIVIGAWVWMTRDQLITLTEASEISHRSPSELTFLKYRGKIIVFPDHSEPNPTRRNRVLLSEIKALPAKGKRARQRGRK